MQSKKLDYKRAGPYTVYKVINRNAYKLDLPKTMRNHNVFHVSQFDRFTPPVSSQPAHEPLRMIVDDSEEWDVDCIPDSKRRYRKLYYLLQWAGYGYVRTSWEPVENLGNAHEIVDEFHRNMQKSRDSGGKGSIWSSFFLSFSDSFDWMRSSTNGLGTGFTTFRSQLSGGGVSPCAVSAGRSWDCFFFVCPFLVCRDAAQEVLD